MSRKSDTARINGAKSHGPTTPEGQAKSSQNSTTHGLTAKSIVLPGESNVEYQALFGAYIDQFDPQGDVERELVETMTARWRLRRLNQIETNLLSTELVRRAEAIDAEFNDMDDGDRLAWVFQKLADRGQSLAVLIRYEATITRSYDRAFKQLRTLQSDRNRPQRNEPNAGAAPTVTARDPLPTSPDLPVSLSPQPISGLRQPVPLPLGQSVLNTSSKEAQCIP